jgi:membrane protein DedA with SNARE-associated domain
MSLEELVQQYGYLAILIGTFLEGETIVIIAGVAAHMGLLELQWVILSALTGSFTGDQLYYYIGRHWGPKIIARRLSWQEGAQKVYRLLHRHQYFLILTFRFYYGLRNVTPFAVGAAHIPRLRFFTLNLTGAIVWAITFAYTGYLFGHAVKLFIADYHRYALYVIGGALLATIAWWIYKTIRDRRRTKQHAAEIAEATTVIPPEDPEKPR